MIYKGIISHIDKVARAAEVIIPILDNQVTPMLKLSYNIDYIQVGDSCLVSLLSENLADGVVLCSLSKKAWTGAESSADDHSGYVLKGNILTQWGIIAFAPTAPNTPTAETLVFSRPFKTKPFVTVNPMVNDGGTAMLGCNATDITPTDCKIYLTRTDTESTTLVWYATGQVI